MLQLDWRSAPDSARGDDYRYYYVVFKSGHEVFVQEDGDTTWSLTVCEPEAGFPMYLRTDFKDALAAQKHLEDNALDIIPGLRKYLG